MIEVSVIIPIYNREKIFRPTLRSALNQTCPNVEIIVVDDASTDGTADSIASEFPEVQLIRLERNGGGAAAVNHGAAAARGEYLSVLDSDDLWSPQKLELQLATFRKTPEASLCFTDIVTKQGQSDVLYSQIQPFRFNDCYGQLLVYGPILPSCAMIRRSDFADLGGFQTHLTSPYDRDLWLRLAPRGPFAYCPLPLVRRVVYADALSRRFPDNLLALYDEVVESFLKRPEGRTYSHRRREFLALQRLKIAGRKLGQGGLASALPYLSRALLKDPLCLLRSDGHKIVLDGVAGSLVRAGRPKSAERIRRWQLTRPRLVAAAAALPRPDPNAFFEPPPLAPTARA